MRWAALRRPLRIVGLVAAALVALAVALSFAAPRLLSGPLAARWLRGLLPPLAGRVDVGGVTLGADAIWGLVFGWPVTITLDDVDVRDPEGTPVLKARRISARVVWERASARIALDDLRFEQGLWRLGRMKKARGVGFFEAFRSARPAAPAPPSAPARAERTTAAGARAAGRGRFEIRGARLEGLEATFDFYGWGLVLRNVTAQGRLEAGEPRSPQDALFGFEVTGIAARSGGQLRIGPDERGATLPFEEARIARVGTSSTGAGALALDVEEARTGRSRLGGRLAFPGLFARGRSAARPGMELDARWRAPADGLTAVLGPRLGGRLRIEGADGDIAASLTGPFDRLAGKLEARRLDLQWDRFRVLDLTLRARGGTGPAALAIDELSARAPEGGRARIEGALEPAGTLRAALTLEGVQTAAYLPPYLQPQLGGVLDGRVAVEAQPRQGWARLSALDLRLARARRGPLPARIRLHQGGRPSRPSRDAADAVLDAFEVNRGGLLIGPLRAHAFGGTAQALLRVRLRDPQTHARLGTPRVDGFFGAQRIALADTAPELGLGGRVSFGAHVTGPLDDVEARVRFAPGSNLEVMGASYGLPPLVSFGVRGDTLVLRSFTIEGPAGSQLVASGSVIFDRRMDLDVGIRRHPLAALPGLARATPPSALEGLVDGNLRLSGPIGAVGASGQIALSRLAYAGVPLGGGGLRFLVGPSGESSFEGRLIDGLEVRGRLLRAPERGWSADARFRDLPVHALWALSPLGRRLRAFASGEAHISKRSSTGADLEAVLNDVHLSYEPPPGTCQGPDCTLEIASDGDVRIAARQSGESVTLAPARLRAGRGVVTVEGSASGGRVSARAHGQVDLNALGPLEPPHLTASGLIEARLSVDGPLAAPEAAGDAGLIEPVRLRSAALPFDVVLTGGRVSYGDGRLAARGLPVEIEGSRLLLDGTVPVRRAAADPLDVRVAGVVDARVVERLARPGTVRTSGSARLSLALTGPPSQPSLSAELVPERVRIESTGLRRAVEVHGGRVTTDGRTVKATGVNVDMEPNGRIVVGPPGRPATIALESLTPLKVGAVDVPVDGRDIKYQARGLELDDVDFALRLYGDFARALRLTGDIRVDGGRFAVPSRGSAASSGGLGGVTSLVPGTADAGRKGQRGPGPPLYLDLHVRAGPSPFVVDPPWLPAVSLGADYHVRGTAARPELDGELTGRTVYSSIALWLYELSR